MTWYASHIYFEPTEDVLTALKAEPILCRGIYVVDNLQGVQWYSKEHEHGLPVAGLGVVRELGSSVDDVHDFEWFGEDALAWDNLVGSADAEEIISPADALGDREEEGYLACAPPIALLVFLKKLAVTTETPVAYYYHASWGGGTEQELAWVFSSQDFVALHKSNATARVLYPSGWIDEEGTVLQVVTREFGVALESPVFALHTPGFAWKRYRVVPDG